MSWKGEGKGMVIGLVFQEVQPESTSGGSNDSKFFIAPILSRANVW
jgi:hypothetical protein